jgi:hypothetical protein
MQSPHLDPTAGDTLRGIDPTAGERARALSRRPGAARRVTDPTDSRYGRSPLPTRQLGGHVGRVVDPTQSRELGGHVGHVVDPTDPASS